MPEHTPGQVPYEEAELIRQCAQHLGLYGLFDYEEITSSIDALKKQRNDLLEACEDALAQLNGHGQDPRGAAIQILVSALVKAEGTDDV